MADVREQYTAKRALEIAAAGGHNIALYGPPGTGKTLLANAFCSILPALSREESLEVTAIHSIAGTLEQPIITQPPLRSPHHTASHVALIGGGSIVRPGEITLAHRGVLFLDEFPEFDRRVLETLRQPLEDGVVSVSRAKGSYRFPARFILVAALNPCPCGYWGTHRECTCSATQLERYKRKLSGPIIDRIDLWVTVDNFDPTKQSDEGSVESSQPIRARVENSRAMQIKRNNQKLNRDLSSKNIEQKIRLGNKAKETIHKANTKLALSPRSYFRVLKVARTIADLEQSETIQEAHILESLQYRPKLDL
jgi:magnesium chelatase family protein